MAKKRKSKHNKKAQGLSMNVIIIATLGIIVLAVLLFLFYGKIKDFGGGLKDIKENTCNNYGDENYKFKEYTQCLDKWEPAYGIVVEDLTKTCCKMKKQP